MILVTPLQRKLCLVLVCAHYCGVANGVEALESDIVPDLPASISSERDAAEITFDGEPVVVDELVDVKAPAPIEDRIVVEVPVTIEEQVAVEESAATEEQVAVETPVAIEERVAVEVPTNMDARVDAKAPAPIEERIVVEVPAALEEQVAVKESTAIVKRVAVEVPTTIAEQVDAKAPAPIEERIVIEEPAAIDEQVAVEGSAATDNQVVVKESSPIEARVTVEEPTIVEQSAVLEVPALENAAVWDSLSILEAEILPRSHHELSWSAGQSFDGSPLDTPIVVIRGVNPGPTLCMTAAVHGDELNGVEIVRRMLAAVEIENLSGTVIGAPIVNLLGFSRGTRYLPDRRDLNRYFPGNPQGSSASRIAYVFFSEVVQHCDYLVDFHTGSFKRTNLPQLRADMTDSGVRSFIERFGATAVLHKTGADGTLRKAATNAGIPAVAFELGEPGTLQLENVEFGVKAMETLMDKLGMVSRFRLWSEPQPVFYQSRWIRAFQGGILTSNAKVGAHLNQGDLLGVVINPINNKETEVFSPVSGRLLGRALNQFILPGFAIFHVGFEAQEIDQDEQTVPKIEEDTEEEVIASDISGEPVDNYPVDDESH